MRARVRHPITRLRKVVVNGVARLLPVALRADDSLQGRVAEVGRQRRRVGVWVACKDEVDVVWACERAQNVVVTERLRLGTGGSRAGIVAGLDLVTAATRTRPRVVRSIDGGLRNQRVIPYDVQYVRTTFSICESYSRV